MKTNRYLFSLLIMVVFLVTGIYVYGSGNILATTANNQTLLVDFFETDTVLVVMPDASVLNAIEKADIENAIFWENEQLRPEYVYKSESEIKRQDKKKHMLFYGCLSQFQRNEFFSIPVRKGRCGFRFNSRKFDQPTDAFFYVNKKADRMYLCKNGADTRHQFFSMGATAYPMHIFSEDKIVVTGTM